MFQEALGGVQTWAPGATTLTLAAVRDLVRRQRLLVDFARPSTSGAKSVDAGEVRRFQLNSSVWSHASVRAVR
jgi:hypothetical protein